MIGFRLVGLALNFLTGVNVNFREMTALDHLQLFGGAVVAGPIGIPNPWAIVPQLSNILLVAFIVDASISLWRRGGTVARRRAALVGGSLGLCIVTAASGGRCRWGGGIGKTFHFGKLPVNTQLSAYYCVAKPDFGANWQIHAQVQLKFPK